MAYVKAQVEPPASFSASTGSTGTQSTCAHLSLSSRGARALREEHIPQTMRAVVRAIPFQTLYRGYRARRLARAVLAFNLRAVLAALHRRVERREAAATRISVYRRTFWSRMGAEMLIGSMRRSAYGERVRAEAERAWRRTTPEASCGCECIVAGWTRTRPLVARTSTVSACGGGGGALAASARRG